MSNKKIFLITGMMRCMANWSDPIAKLQETFPDYEIVPLENQGVGIHHKAKAPLTIKANVEFLRTQFLEQKGETNILLGFSLGGMMVTTWSQLYSKDMHGLILVTSSFGGLQPFWKRMKLGILPAGTATCFTKGKTREKFMYKMIASNPDNRERLIKQWALEQSARPLGVLNIIRQLLSGWSFNPRGYEKKHPTLVIGSRYDKLADYTCSEKIRDFFDTDYVCHENAGHDVLNDDPEWVANSIKKWIDEKQIS